VIQTEQQKQTAQQAAGVVISTASGKAYAAVVKRRGSEYERTFQSTFELSEGLDSIVKHLLEKAGGGSMPVLIGLDSAQIRFLEMTLPPAPTAHLPSLIRTQTESRLPLDGDRMQLAWRLSPATAGYDCTVAVVRQDVLDASLKKYSLNGSLTAMVPDAAGFARLRNICFAPTPQTCLVLRRRADGFILLRLEGDAPVRCGVIAVEPADMEQRPGLVIQEIMMEIEAIESKDDQPCPVYLWPGDDPFMRDVAARLAQSGRQVAALEADQAAMQRICSSDNSSLGGVEIDAAGLAILGLSSTTPAFDFLLTRRLVQPAEEAKKRKKKMVRMACMIVVLAVLGVLVHYVSLTIQVRQLQRELAAEENGLVAQSLLGELTYQEAVARARLDVLEMIEAVQDSREGMLLDSLEFEKGKPVKLVATAGSYEQVYAFQKRLEEHEGVNQVRLVDPRLDDRTRQVRFTLQFHYFHFTK